MNDFIEMRKRSYKSRKPVDYPLLFLEDYLRITSGLDDQFLNRRMEMLKRLTFKRTLDRQDRVELIVLLGENPYLDRFIVDVLIKKSDEVAKKMVGQAINRIIRGEEKHDQKLYHLFEIAIECGIDNLEGVSLLLEKDHLDLDVLAIVVDYINEFNKDGFGKQLNHLLGQDYPETIKIQILKAVVTSSSHTAADNFIKLQNLSDPKKAFFHDYLTFKSGDIVLKKQGISLLQAMFYGDFEDSGKGNNGGLAVLLKTLGDQLAKDSRTSLVVSITLDQSLDKAFISYCKKHHVFIRLPFYLQELNGRCFMKRELAVKRQIGHFLKKAQVIPDIFHIRYLDNASKAVATLSKELDKKLVLTLTPDPHRAMVDDRGKLKRLSLEDLYEKLNKIKIGDELLQKSDRLLGIGDKKVAQELEGYFPQLQTKKIKMIAEGIRIDSDLVKKDQKGRTVTPLKGIGKDFFKRPIILNVGRLAIQKGQIELLKAWANSRLWQNYNLLIVGDDLDKASKEEKEVIDFFKAYLSRHPHLKDRFFHQGAMPNSQIRNLEKNIIKKSFDYPHLYLCSSKKEEFGLAILEAMAQGFLVLGPLKGGVKSYLKNGTNGFLINTSSWQSIKNDCEKYIYDSKIDQAAFRKIQAGGQKTVKELFSMTKISSEFLSFYLSIEGDNNDN